MKIALLTLTSGTVSGGYAKYLRELVPRLREREELRVWVPAVMANNEYLPWTSLRTLRAEVMAWKPDVVFIPHSTYLDCGNIPGVTMVRNMEPLEHPFGGNTLHDALRNVARIVVARRACKRSARVIAVSEHVRDVILKRWHLDPQKVGVVYHGVDTSLATRRPASLPDDGTPFLFTAGSIRPARGLDDLLGVPIPAGHRLIIAGAPDRGSEQYAARLREKLDALWTGRLTPEEMAWCFEHARVFVMTSRAEACPNTVLEALAHRSLSVSTDQPPMPEFFSDAALYYERRNPRSLGSAIERALALPPEDVATLRERAATRSRAFTWDATVEHTLAELRSAAGGTVISTPGAGAQNR